MVKPSQLKLLAPSLNDAKVSEYIAHINDTLVLCVANNKLRIAMFLAQTLHESAEYKFLRELWGPTPQQLKYEPPHDLAYKLGNVHIGDGFKYRGAGIIMWTGRSNFNKVSNALNVDFVADPDLLATPKYAFRSASVFWNQHDLNTLADLGDVKGVTKIINGGFNGLQSRQTYYTKALTIL